MNARSSFVVSEVAPHFTQDWLEQGFSARRLSRGEAIHEAEDERPS
jgi:hypothetical protein